MSEESRKPYKAPQLTRLGSLDRIDLANLSPSRLRLILQLRAEYGTADDPGAPPVDPAVPPEQSDPEGSHPSGRRHKG